MTWTTGTDARPAARDRRSRATLAVVAVGLVAIGLLVTLTVGGLAGDLLGGALYAALVHVLVAQVRPGARPLAVGAVALGLCVAVELAQLTPVPAALVEVWSPWRYVLGSTFAPLDLPAYAVGVGVAGVVDAATLRRRRRG